MIRSARLGTTTTARSTVVSGVTSAGSGMGYGSVRIAESLMRVCVGGVLWLGILMRVIAFMANSVAKEDEWVEHVCTCSDIEIATQLCPTCKAYMRGIIAERERLVREFPRLLKMMPGMIVVTAKKYREYAKRIST